MIIMGVLLFTFIVVLVAAIGPALLCAALLTLLAIIPGGALLAPWGPGPGGGRDGA